MATTACSRTAWPRPGAGLDDPRVIISPCPRPTNPPRPRAASAASRSGRNPTGRARAEREALITAALALSVSE
eukprot:scaffold294132_cov40-Tisochrysis_lutea.AAC.3